jgi:hypothetical protein
MRTYTLETPAYTLETRSRRLEIPRYALEIACYVLEIVCDTLEIENYTLEIATSALEIANHRPEMDANTLETPQRRLETPNYTPEMDANTLEIAPSVHVSGPFSGSYAKNAPSLPASIAETPALRKILPSNSPVLSLTRWPCSHLRQRPRPAEEEPALLFFSAISFTSLAIPHPYGIGSASHQLPATSNSAPRDFPAICRR